MTTPDSSEKPTLPPMTREEIAFLIKAMWAALRAPGWTFKNRKDLEKLGEAIFAGKDLRDLDDALYDRIFPHLVTIATHLGDTLRSSEPSKPAQAPAPELPAPPATLHVVVEPSPAPEEKVSLEIPETTTPQEA